MIYDSKETLMDVEGRLWLSESDETELLRYEVDGNGLEDGKRYLAIPQGLRNIASAAFSEYNDGGIVLNLQNKLALPDRAREDWQKKLRGQRVIKITFPEGVESWFDKAEFMRKKELRVRFLRLYIPKSVEKLDAARLPKLLEKIIVDEENSVYASDDGVLYDKEKKTLLRYPGYRDEKESFEIPPSVTVAAGAFGDAVLSSLTIPCSARLEEGAFENAIIDELIFEEGIETIKSGVFRACDIRKIVLPKSLKEIEDYAFRETAGVSSIVHEGETPKLGEGIFAYGYFRDVSWWPWEEIPKGGFINAHIKNIVIPEGVKNIGDYAFAGSYRAKKISLPESLEKVEKKSFDMGPSFSADVELPESLLKYCYRFPALSKINGMRKMKAWSSRPEKERSFTEDEDVLAEQRAAFLAYADKLGVLQGLQKQHAKQEAEYISQIISSRRII